MAYDTGTGRTVLSLYPLAHHRFWPGLWPAFKEVFFCSHTLLKDLEPELGMAAASRLEKIRHRAETLVAFFSRESGEDVLPAHKSKEPGAVLQEGVFPLERAENADQDQGEISLPKAIDSVPSVSAIPDTGSLPLKAPQKKKKGKSPEDQMKLF